MQCAVIIGYYQLFVWLQYDLLVWPGLDRYFYASPEQCCFCSFVRGIGLNIEAGCQNFYVYTGSVNNKRFGGIMRHVEQGFAGEAYFPKLYAVGFIICETAACIQPDMRAVG